MIISDVLRGDQRDHVFNCRAEDLLNLLPDGCVSLIVTDPPYYRVKNESWDRAWADETEFLAWIGGIFDRFRRVLAMSGSLYLFASPNMAWGVEGELRRRFRLLTNIRWKKPPHGTKAEMFRKEDLRAPFPASETVLFAEHTGEASSEWGAKCEEAKRLVFGEYLRSEMQRAGRTAKDVAALFPSKSGGVTGCVSNWVLGFNCPTREQYESIRAYFNNNCGDTYLRREYEDLRREYEELRREYEDLRRPFFASDNGPYTDVWEYATVSSYEGKHPCEKPWKMALDIITVSSRPGDIVLDTFCGSGTFPAAAVSLGRKAIACDADPHWSAFTQRRIKKVIATGDGRVRNALSRDGCQVPMFTDCDELGAVKAIK